MASDTVPASVGAETKFASSPINIQIGTAKPLVLIET